MNVTVNKTSENTKLQYPGLLVEKFGSKPVIVLAISAENGTVLHSDHPSFNIGNEWGEHTESATLFAGQVILEN